MRRKVLYKKGNVYQVKMLSVVASHDLLNHATLSFFRNLEFLNLWLFTYFCVFMSFLTNYQSSYQKYLNTTVKDSSELWGTVA